MYIYRERKIHILNKSNKGMYIHIDYDVEHNIDYDIDYTINYNIDYNVI